MAWLRTSVKVEDDMQVFNIFYLCCHFSKFLAYFLHHSLACILFQGSQNLSSFDVGQQSLSHDLCNPFPI